MMRGPQKHHNNVAVHRLARRLLRDAATHMNGRWARGESQRSGVNPLIVQRPDDTNKAKGAVIHAAVMDETSHHYTQWNHPNRPQDGLPRSRRSEEHTTEHQSLMRNSYAVFSYKQKQKK